MLIMTTHPANVATEDLFTYARRIAFASMTERDFSGLQSACRRVYDLMKDGQWHTAQAIIDASGQREGMRRMRELRQIGYQVEERRETGRREWQYRLVSP
jgi:hypothetical protein